ncbi:MAG: (Fe-S)-binding protein, partial [Actinomycetes bacterium]
MAPTGLEIYKLLPRTNCKECGFPTCLAFAMKLAQKGTELDKCPYVSDEAKTALDAASAPPIKLVAVGAGERAFEVGNEVAMFRHEKTFYHQPGLVVRVRSDDPQLAEVAAKAAAYVVERVGMELKLDGLAVEDAGGDAAAYAAAVAAARAAAPGLPLVLMSGDAAALDAALAAGAAAEKPLIHAATAANWQAMAEIAKKHGCPLAIRADGGDVSATARRVASAWCAGANWRVS